MNKLSKIIEKRDNEFKKLKFKGSFYNYFEYCNKLSLIDNKFFRVRKNSNNLGFWIVKDTQGKHTLNLWIIRLQF